jgi:hypothetical protein
MCMMHNLMIYSMLNLAAHYISLFASSPVIGSLYARTSKERRSATCGYRVVCLYDLANILYMLTLRVTDCTYNLSKI